MQDDEDLILTLAQFPLAMADLIQRIAGQRGTSPVRRQRLMALHQDLTDTASEATEALTQRRNMDTAELLSKLQRALSAVDDAMGDLEAGFDAMETR